LLKLSLSGNQIFLCQSQQTGSTVYQHTGWFADRLPAISFRLSLKNNSFPSLQISSTEDYKKKTDYLLARQPGYLFKTRSFPSLPHDRFGIIIIFYLQ